MVSRKKKKPARKRPAKPKGGNRSKFTAWTRARILRAIRRGATYELAAACGRVSYETLRKWMRAGEQGRSEIEGVDAKAFIAFYEQLLATEGEAAEKWLGKIDRAKDWKAAAWKLERRYPRAYGRTVHDVHVNPTTARDELAAALGIAPEALPEPAGTAL